MGAVFHPSGEDGLHHGDQLPEISLHPGLHRRFAGHGGQDLVPLPQAAGPLAQTQGLRRILQEGGAVLRTHALRQAGLAAEQDVAGRSFKAQMKAAGASGAEWTCIIGPEELEKGVAAVKNMGDGTQENVPLAEVPAYIAGKVK